MDQPNLSAQPSAVNKPLSSKFLSDPATVVVACFYAAAGLLLVAAQSLDQNRGDLPQLSKALKLRQKPGCNSENYGIGDVSSVAGLLPQVVDLIRRITADIDKDWKAAVP